jgi:hypothetical protein
MDCLNAVEMILKGIGGGEPSISFIFACYESNGAKMVIQCSSIGGMNATRHVLVSVGSILIVSRPY